MSCDHEAAALIEVTWPTWDCDAHCFKFEVTVKRQKVEGPTALTVGPSKSKRSPGKENISHERMPAKRTAVNDGSDKKLCKNEATGEPRTSLQLRSSARTGSVACG